MLNLWFILSEKFLKLSLREQYLILLSGTVILLLSFSSFVFDNEQLKVERINRSLSQLTNDNNKIAIDLQHAKADISNDPNNKLQQEITQAAKQLAEVDKQLYSLTPELISPVAMRKALTAMLKSTDKINIITFQSMPVEPLITSSASAEISQQQKVSLFRHRIKISLSGQYLALRDYLKGIEAMPWTFYWQQFDYRADGFDDGQLDIEIYSLSSNEEFIGV